MKKIVSFIILFCFAGFLHSQTWELFGKDTINKIDVDGRKQARWILMGKHKPGSCYQPEQKAEEGKYKDNRKTDTWIEYYCNNNLKNKLTFVNGKPDGYAQM